MEENPSVYYRAWGVDNIAYGPVELPALVGWIREGRVLPTTWVFKDDPGVWSRASELSELKAMFKGRGTAGSGGSAEQHGIKPGSLRRIKMFADMDERLLASLLQYIEVLKLPTFAAVVRKGEHGDALFMVLEGELRARVLVDGKETTLSTMGVGECFGELALVDQGPRSADVVTNQETVLLKLSEAGLKKLFTEAPALAAPFLLALNRVIAQRVRHLTKRYEDSVHFARTASQ